jgi:hypothetical protein
MICLSEFALDDVVIHGADAATSHVTDCARCQRRVAAREAAREGFRSIGPALWPAVLEGRRARTRRFWQRPFFMAPLALAGAMALVLVTRVSPPSPYWGAKGALSLSIVARRGDEVFALDAGRRAQPGDALRFLPAAPSPFRFVTIVSVDGRDDVTFFYPSSGQDRSVPLPPAGQALPGSIVLDDAPGPERLLVALTDQPIVASELRAAALAHRAESAGQFGGAKALLFWTTIEKESPPRGSPGAP